MKAEAFGEIGIRVDDFYRMDTSDYVLLKKGFNQGRNYEQLLFRKLAEFIIAPWTKNLDITKIWRVEGDEERKKNYQERISEGALHTLQRLKGNDFSYVKVTEVVNGKKVSKIIEVPNKTKEN